MTKFRTISWMSTLAIAAVASQASAVAVKVTITSLLPTGGPAISPFFLAAHNGSFDIFNSGSAANAAIQQVAELGGPGPLLTAFAAAQPGGVAVNAPATVGGFGPGIYLPGASGSVTLDLNPATQRYLSYASMIVPSNDAFVGNDSATSAQLFDAGGNFVATNFTVKGSDLWDAGTEVNQLFGSAFITGQNITDHVAENGLVTPTSLPAQFSLYNGLGTLNGGTFSFIPGAATPIVSFAFQVVPEPTTAAAFAGAAIALLRRRKMA